MSTLAPLPSLPPEIILEILDRLPISSITRLEQCSKNWQTFLRDQHARVWSRQIPSTAPWPIIDTSRQQTEQGWADDRHARTSNTLSRSLYDVQDWKEYCKKRTLLQRNWRGGARAERSEQTNHERPPSPPTWYSRSGRRSTSSLSAGLPFWRTDPFTRRIREGLSMSSQAESAKSNVPPGCYLRDVPNGDENAEKDLYKLPRIKQSTYTLVEGRLVWRFRPDFDRRFILTTARHGGLQVIDMDSSSTILWSLPDILPFAHLEYDKGWAVWNNDSDGLEVWQCMDDGEDHGAFKHITTLRHSHQIRGFHLVYPTLCIVSTDGRAFVYDLSQAPGQMLQIDFAIETDARGHLFQYEDVVMYCFEKKGYHFHTKATGEQLGILDPKKMGANLPVSQLYHIKHDFPTVCGIPKYFVQDGPHDTYASRIEQAVGESLRRRRHAETTPLRAGPIDETVNGPLKPLEDDEWGAPSLWYNWMVCISRSGRTLLCSDWRGALQSEYRAAECTTIIECHKTGEDFRFDFGGWLSVAHGRVMWEIDDWVYILHLPLHPDEKLGDVPIWCIPGVADATFSNPISFMGLYEDCLMTTYTSIRVSDQRGPDNFPRLTHTKTVRVVSFEPPGQDDDDHVIMHGQGAAPTSLRSSGTARAAATEDVEDSAWEDISGS